MVSQSIMATPKYKIEEMTADEIYDLFANVMVRDPLAITGKYYKPQPTTLDRRTNPVDKPSSL